MASEWLAYLWLDHDDMTECGCGVLDSMGQPIWHDEWEGPVDDGFSDVYVHRDAARAWQVFRDWLNFGESS